jgi:hypothetical protein
MRSPDSNAVVVIKSDPTPNRCPTNGAGSPPPILRRGHGGHSNLSRPVEIVNNIPKSRGGPIPQLRRQSRPSTKDDPQRGRVVLTKHLIPKINNPPQHSRNKHQSGSPIVLNSPQSGLRIEPPPKHHSRPKRKREEELRKSSPMKKRRPHDRTFPSPQRNPIKKLRSGKRRPNSPRRPLGRPSSPTGKQNQPTRRRRIPQSPVISPGDQLVKRNDPIRIPLNPSKKPRHLPLNSRHQRRKLLIIDNRTDLLPPSNINKLPLSKPSIQKQNPSPQLPRGDHSVHSPPMIPSKKGDNGPRTQSMRLKSPSQSIGPSIKLVIRKRPELVDKPHSKLVAPSSNPSRPGDRPKLPQDQQRPQGLIGPQDRREPSPPEHIKPTNSSRYLRKRPQHVADLLVVPSPRSYWRVN